MKKQLLLISLFILLTITNVLAQIPNGNFDSWHTVSQQYQEPVNWTTDNDQQDGYNVVMPTTAYAGAAAANVINHYDGVIYHALLSGILTSQFPYASRPTFLKGYFKAYMQVNDTATIIVGFTKAGAAVAGAIKYFTSASNTGSYTAFSIPITYLNGNTPDTASIIISNGFNHFKASSPVNDDSLIIDELTFDFTSGINEVSNNGSFVSFPNPANNAITVSVSTFKANENVSASIINVLGERVSSPVIIQRNSETLTVDISNLPTGIYFAEISGDKQKTVVRFVKE